MSHNLVKVLPRSTLRGQIVSKVLDAIFVRELKGGDRLIEEELAMKLGVSRTPIREALSELASIGVIQLKPNLGAVVRPFGPPQLLEIYQIRRLLEAEATRMAGKRGVDRAALKKMRAESQALLDESDRGAAWSESVVDVDLRFHELISESSGSERLAEEIARYRTLIQSIRRALGNRMSAQVDALKEHLRVIEELEAGEPDNAAEEMARHIQHGAENAAVVVFAEAPAKKSGRGGRGTKILGSL
ncbi:MAG TPA: GntR family transcriptional regulator [Tepidisphaeraceae bacterium]|jgi:DNA-binding GntR family transcriptional regulator|nr:GntR family transcriptional regulator [Tepidisphaeraceae bacterium]